MIGHMEKVARYIAKIRDAIETLHSLSNAEELSSLGKVASVAVWQALEAELYDMLDMEVRRALRHKELLFDLRRAGNYGLDIRPARLDELAMVQPTISSEAPGSYVLLFCEAYGPTSADKRLVKLFMDDSAIDLLAAALDKLKQAGAGTPAGG